MDSKDQYGQDLETANERIAELLRELEIIQETSRAKGYEKLHQYMLSVTAERDKLQSFKDYVHARLDAADVPTHPDGAHSQEGCRVGDRLDLVIGERNKYARALAHAWEYAAALRTISGQFFAVPPAPTIVKETAARASVLVAEIERGKDDG